FQLGLVLELGRAANVVVGGALRSSGDARFASLVGGALMWLVAVPLSYVLGLRMGLGVVGVWLAMACDECLRGYITHRRWLSGVWQRYCVREGTSTGCLDVYVFQVRSVSYAASSASSKGSGRGNLLNCNAMHTTNIQPAYK